MILNNAAKVRPFCTFTKCLNRGLAINTKAHSLGEQADYIFNDFDYDNLRRLRCKVLLRFVAF